MKKKICTKCKLEQGIDQFKKYSRSKDGFDYWCRACNLQSSKRWLANNPEKKVEQSKRASSREKEKRKNPATRDVILQYSRVYYQKHKDQVSKRTALYSKEKYKVDPSFKTLSLLRSRISHALRKYKGVKKATKTINLIGCSVEELRSHLEKQFQPGMSWENQGEWHIDHIKPCASFEFTNEEEQKVCFHYTNLQPLWAVDNIKKGIK